MDHFKCSREIIALIEKKNVPNRCRQITDFIQYVHSWNQEGIIIINYISLLQHLLYKNIVNLKECMAAIVLLFTENSQLQTSQIADMPWIADKMFSSKCNNLLNYLPIVDTSQ